MPAFVLGKQLTDSMYFGIAKSDRKNVECVEWYNVQIAPLQNIQCRTPKKRESETKQDMGEAHKAEMACRQCVGGFVHLFRVDDRIVWSEGVKGRRIAWVNTVVGGRD